MNRMRTWTVAAALGAVATGGAISAQGRGVPSEIAFFSIRSGNNEIYVMSWDGRAPLQITDDPAGDFDPAISPNGTDISFRSMRIGMHYMHVVGSVCVSLRPLVGH